MDLDRCAAYVAARAALHAVVQTTRGWPAPLAARARSAASEAVTATADSLAHDHASSGRQRRVRDALAAALQVAAACDIARASGAHGLDPVQRAAGQAIVALALLLHANVYVPNA